MSEIRAFAEQDLEAVMRLAATEGWPSLASNAERALCALTAPGALSLVAVAGGRVVGYAHALTDGVTTTYLSTIAVDASYRGRHFGRQLIEEIVRRSGVERVDLLSEPESEPFYQRLSHFQKPGYRLYPGA